MELRVLQYFLAVAREQNISSAAESLHISQPALSTQLKALEKELGKELLIRGTKGSRKVLLTEEGMLLRKRAEEILELVPMFITTLSQTRMKSRFLAADKYISPKKSNSVGASWLKPSRKIAHLRLSSPPYIMEAQRRQAR